MTNPLPSPKKQKAMNFVLSGLLITLIISVGINFYLFTDNKSYKLAQNKKPLPPVLAEVTKTQPENLEYFLMNRQILQSCDFLSEQSINYDDYFNTLVNQIKIIADSEFINKSQQKTIAVLSKNKFYELYGNQPTPSDCQEAYKFAEFKWKELNPKYTNENEIDISNKKEITTPIEPQLNGVVNNTPNVPLPAI